MLRVYVAWGISELQRQAPNRNWSDCTQIGICVSWTTERSWRQTSATPQTNGQNRPVGGVQKRWSRVVFRYNTVLLFRHKNQIQVDAGQAQVSVGSVGVRETISPAAWTTETRLIACPTLQPISRGKVSRHVHHNRNFSIGDALEYLVFETATNRYWAFVCAHVFFSVWECCVCFARAGAWNAWTHMGGGRKHAL